MTWTQERSRLARLHKDHAPDSPEVQAARRDLRAARLEEHISRVVAAAPPLTRKQRDRLTLLLNSSSASNSGESGGGV